MPAAPKAAKPKAEEPPQHETLEQALLAAQAEMPTVEKLGVNDHFKSKYVTLDKLMETCLPIVNRHGLIWMTRPTDRGTLLYSVVHAASKERVEGEMLLLAAKDDPQGQGAAITYARRFSFSSVFGVVADQDDDGNTATAARQASRQRQSETRHGPEIIPADEMRRMVQAIREKGLEPIRVYEQVGITEPTKVTRDQANAVRNLLAQETLV